MSNWLTYLGHASVKIRTASGVVIYIDPYFGDDYSEPADIILVTHGHDDHDRVEKPAKKKDCRVITYREALSEGVYRSFDAAGVAVKAVPAYNKNHSKDASVGFVVEFDGIKLYHAGDTSKTAEMPELAKERLDYALLPMDNVYNMGPEEADECAELIGARHNIPIHSGPNGVFGEANIARFRAKGKLVVKPDETIELRTD